jgi:hypothetical protein
MYASAQEVKESTKKKEANTVDHGIYCEELEARRIGKGMLGCARLKLV